MLKYAGNKFWYNLKSKAQEHIKKHWTSYCITRMMIYGNYSQGPDVTSTREVSLTIPIEEIANVMRAIGFYPSEQEVYTIIIVYIYIIMYNDVPG